MENKMSPAPMMESNSADFLLENVFGLKSRDSGERSFLGSILDYLGGKKAGIEIAGKVTKGLLRPSMKSYIDGRVVAIVAIKRFNAILREAKVGDEISLELGNTEYDSLKGKKGTLIHFVQEVV